MDGKSLVGVTQAYAASVLRNTSGVLHFVIGRDKDPENSEVAQLIRQSLQVILIIISSHGVFEPCLGCGKICPRWTTCAAHVCDAYGSEHRTYFCFGASMSSGRQFYSNTV